jgi:hypothetical protein
MSHLAFTIVLALLLAIAMALIEDRTGRERVYLGVYWFCSALACVIAGAWIMRWIHG